MLKLMPVIFLLFFFSNCFAKPLQVQIGAESAILMNAETGKILFEKNAYKPMNPASLTKIATALYVLEKARHSLDQTVVVDSELIKTVDPIRKQQALHLYSPYSLESDGTMIYLKPGEEITLRSLLDGLLLSSGNDAANVLAASIGGSVETFMKELNEYLLSKGFKNTTFLNPHGLYYENHLSTAYDLARLGQLALKDPLICEIVRAPKIYRPATNKRAPSHFIQTNRLLKAGQYYYPKALGMKTGYHARAGYNLLAVAEYNGRCLIAVLLKNKESQQRYQDAIQLFEAAFQEEKHERILFAKRADVFRLKLPRAKGNLEAVLNEDLVLSYYPSEEPQIKAMVVWREVKPPIKKGTVVGDMVIKSPEGTSLMSAPIYALHDVDATLFASTLDWLQDKKHFLFHNRIVIVFGLSILILLISIYLRAKKTPT